MTRLPLPSRQSPANAATIFGALRSRLSFVLLAPEEYLQTIDSLVALGIPGSQVYDALLVACARKIGAERIYTWNLKDFHAVAPDLAGRIVEP
jgi:predicted nucleic acid-binding protein